MELNALPLRIAGLGAVSPAGWGCGPLVAAVQAGQPLAHEETTRVPGALVQRWRRVPRPAAVASFAREPRLRRTSPITGFAVAAALEALGPEREARVKAGALRLGVVVVMLNGCVGFSRRFYGEVLDNPSTASPLIFPETVFNAPSSHLASLLGAGGVNYTLVGDTAQFLTAFDLAALWLENGEVDGVLAVAAEEADWLTGEAAALFDKSVIVAEGAGAVYLETSRTSQVILQRPVAIGLQRSRRQAAAEMRGMWRRQFGADEHQQLLCDGLVGARRVDAAEARAFADWGGGRLSPGQVLGDGLGARAAWQCIVAASTLTKSAFGSALVSAVGTNQQALGLLMTQLPEPGT